MSLQRPERMKTPLHLDVSGVGFLGGVKRANVPAPATDHDSCQPTPTLRRPNHANQTTSAAPSRFSVLLILRVRGLSQIRPAVIRSIAADMVDLSAGPFACHPKPSKPMRKKGLLPNVDATVSVVGGQPRDSAGGFATPTIVGDSPSEDPRLCFVVKQLAQALCGKIRLIHDALQKLIGQKPASVESAVRALPF